jgi:pseudaminic acid synthase
MIGFPARFEPGCPPFIIAELSGNHKGDLDRAKRLIDAAKRAGADAVKLQTYTADTITMDVDRPEFRLEGGLWAGKTLYQLYGEAQTPWDWHPALFEHAAALGLPAFSSPFDLSAIDFLETLGAPAYKIASFELLDLELIAKAAATGKPLIMSAGMASLGEIGEAVAAARDVGNDRLTLLHCVSGYPTPYEECDLRTIPHMAAAFGVPVGLSDHTLGIAAPVAAVALGAVVIEKHFTLARADGGPDAAFSLEPHEFAAMAEACRMAHAALGAISYQIKPSESGGRQFRRSLYVDRAVKAGEILDRSAVRSIRPGLGLAPRYLPEVLGRRATRDLERGEPVDWSMLGPRA